jgi:hypothetical protein
MKNVTTLAIGIIIGMTIVHSINLSNKPKPRSFKPVSQEQFEKDQPPILQEYGKLIVD